ncbi:MAG: CocE/NonD family hydrolase [Lachnospiraceae bacterium]|nr:CocE/NonD family hydrolase [Lachnospiraceae bacterium]
MPEEKKAEINKPEIKDQEDKNTGKTEFEIRMEAMLKRLRESYEALPYPVLFGEDQIRVTEEMLPAADGTGLRTIITRPDTEEALPVIVQRCCYPMQENMIRVIAKEYAMRGFGYVLQFCRGTGGSEGVWEPNVNDRSDGLSLMNYLEEEAWVKCMGYQGASYLSFTGWIMADAMPEKVKALYLTVYGTDRHTSAYKDGLFRQDILTAWARDNAGRKIDADYLKSAAYRPQVEVDTALWGGELSWYRDWITHTSRTDDYWKEGLWKELREIPGKVTIPIYMVEGWYDHHLGSALNGYIDIKEETKEHSVLKIGPWNHSMQPAITGHPDQQNGFSKEAADMFAWFYEILVEGRVPEKKIDWYVIGKDEWISLPEYPVKPEKEAVFCLADNGKLVSGGILEEASAKGSADSFIPEKVSENGSRSYLYDPEKPLMSHGGESLFQTRDQIGSLLQPEPDFRPDVISFVSEPLTEDLTMIGKLKARLFVSSDAEDTCFTVKIMEVFENGEAYNIRNGLTTLAYRNDSPDRIAYTPGTVEEIGIETWDVAWMAKAGSRIRVDISSSNFPEYAVHPNIAGIWSMIRETKPAQQTVYFGKDHPSRLILPIGTE